VSQLQKFEWADRDITIFMEQQNRKIAYLPALTGVRFLAALMVFFYHYGQKIPSFKINGHSVLNIIFDEFYIGVGIFFVLSGFVIAYNYYDKDFSEKGSVVNFILRRIVRIFPLYILLSSVYYGYNFYKGIQYTPQEYVLNLFLLKGYSNIYWNSGIVQAWSLTSEENFYLLAPVIFYLIKKNVKYYKLIALLFLAGLFIFFVFRIFPLWGLFGDIKTLAFNTFFGRCFEFFVGIIIAVYFKKNIQYLSGKYNKEKVFLKKITYIGIILVIFCIMLQIAVKLKYGTQPLIRIPVNNFLVPVGVGCFLFGLLVEKTIVCRFLENKFVVILGYSSFAFYLLHAGIIANFFMNLFQQHTMVLLLFLQGLSICMFYLFEKPVKKYLTKSLHLQK
jgi:peptidoglycan/LPS O-acetylase OafA/YrhL